MDHRNESMQFNSADVAASLRSRLASLEAERDNLREVMIKAAGKLVINRPEDEEGWLRADRVMREAAIQLRDAAALNTGETITDSTD